MGQRMPLTLAPAAQCCLVLLLLCLPALAAALPADRTLYRSQAKRWRTAADAAQRGAKTSVKQFLEQHGQALSVPVELDVYLIGFNGDGGFGYTLQASKLSSLLSSALSSHCPTACDSGEELGVCFQPNFQVLGGEEVPEVSSLLRQLEAELKLAMVPHPPALDDDLRQHTKDIYTVEATRLEPLFNSFMEIIYADEQQRSDSAAAAGHGNGGASAKEAAGPHAWHRHNAIFVINPSKPRINPRVNLTVVADHRTPDFFAEWTSGALDEHKLEAEDGNFAYRYSYNGAGEAAAWLSSQNYMVIDVSAGPSEFGPVVSRSGAVGHNAIPSVKDVLAAILHELQGLHLDRSSQAAALQLAQLHGQHSMFASGLSAALLSATQHVFMPDMRAQHIEYAKNILIPIVVIADHDLGGLPKGLSYVGETGVFHGVNITEVDASLLRLLDEEQQAMVFTAAQRLHDHRALAAALHKSSRSIAQAVLDPTAPGHHDDEEHGGAEHAGYHVQSSTFIDGEALLEEFMLAADGLTMGLIEGAHKGESHATTDHPLSALQHNGTRVLPVFVLSLMHAPEDVVLSTRELMAASHDAIIVLQLRGNEKWGVPDEFYTGHVANGKRVVTDGRDSTRHVIAGLAQALTGLVPPYERHSANAEHPILDWRWAVGATPFGPYSNFPGISTIQQNIARRNLLIGPASAALKSVQEHLDETDEVVAHYFSGPWEAGTGLSEGGRHWLHTTAAVRHGFNASLHPSEVADLEGLLEKVGTELEQLSMALFTHQFKAAARIVGTELLRLASSFGVLSTRVVEATEEVMQCCAISHHNSISAALVTILACAGAVGVFFLLLLVGVIARGSRRKQQTTFAGLPTYGLPTYSSRQRTWSS